MSDKLAACRYAPNALPVPRPQRQQNGQDRRMKKLNALITAILLSPLPSGCGPSKTTHHSPLDHSPYFAIEVIDQQTGRGVPMVELQTTNGTRYGTDSNGLIAFHEPGLMEEKVFFGVSSHGYEFPPDGFGIRGIVLETKPGANARIKVQRINIAERLYRSTGQGIYRDTVLLGRKPPIAQ